MKKIKIIFLLVLGFILIGCNKSNIDVFRFVNHEIEVQKGKEVTLELIYGEFSEDSEVIYTISKQGIISLEGNVATGLAVGEVTVTAKIKDKKTNIIVKVVNELISSMQINVSKDVLYVGESVSLSVSVIPANLSNEVVWSIENNQQSKASAIEFDEEKGLLIAKIGEETQAEFLAGGAKVIVVATSVADPSICVKKAFTIKTLPTLTLTADKTTIKLSEDTIITPTFNPAFAYPVTYVSSDETLVLVGADGKVSIPVESTNTGTATITATTINGIQATIDITVTE